MSKYLADTTVVIEMLRGNLSAKNFLENRPAISAVTAAELIQKQTGFAHCGKNPNPTPTRNHRHNNISNRSRAVKTLPLIPRAPVSGCLNCSYGYSQKINPSHSQSQGLQIYRKTTTSRPTSYPQFLTENGLANTSIRRWNLFLYRTRISINRHIYPSFKSFYHLESFLLPLCVHICSTRHN